MDNKDQRNGVPMGTFQQDGNNDAVQGVDAERGSADPAEADTTPDFVAGRPSRKRVRTLLGVPLAEALRPDAARADRTEDISEAIQSILDDEAIAVDIEELDDDIPLVADSDLSEYVDSAPPGVLQPVAAAPASASTDFPNYTSAADDEVSSPGLPLLIPTQYAAQARDRDSDSLVDTHKRPATVSAARATASSRSVATAETPVSIAPTPISSLAPREVRRPAAPVQRESRVGLMMVAAMALVAGGGWWMTAGSFSRSGDRSVPVVTGPQAVSQPQAAPTTAEQMAVQAAPLATAPQPSASPAVAEAEAVSTAKPTVASRSKTLTATNRPRRVKTDGSAKLPAPASDIPEAPSRAMVVQRLESVRPSVQACAAGRSGVADLDITIAHSGVVTHVLVGGDFAGTMQGSCIARAVREARFPTFKQERLRLLFPYAI